MEIRWNNVVALALAVLVTVLLVKLHEPIGAFLSTMGSLGPYGDPDERALGLVAFGLVIITLVALVAILRNSRGG